MHMKTNAVLSLALLASMSPAAYAQYITAGTLYVDLRATNTTAGSSVWRNEASGFGADMNFTNFGVPVLFGDVNNTAVPGVFFGGAAAYTGPRTVPDLDGASDRSIEVWALNPAVGDDECVCARVEFSGRCHVSLASAGFG